MATILAYTSPAMGHMLPISSLLRELSKRGHNVHLRTLSTCVGLARDLGFETYPIDPRIEAIELDDWKAPGPKQALRRGVAVFGRRAGAEVRDLTHAIEAVDPDALLVDVNCWGALSLAEASGRPWACFVPYTPPLRSRAVPPFGLGLRPLPGLLGRARDEAVRMAVSRPMEQVMLPPINAVRRQLGLPAVDSMDAFLRRAPLTLVASGKPFQYPQTDWGPTVEMIGPCSLDPPSDTSDEWLTRIDEPVVLVTTSSEYQADTRLASTAVTALAHDAVHVVVTLPAGRAEGVVPSSKVTVCRLAPHGPVLQRAVCAVTHGGMGATQKALAHGVPVCVVPFGRDQFEVARRVEVAKCGARLSTRKLTPARLRVKIHDAMTMTSGARRVAAGFEATGGTARGADVFEHRLLRR